MFAQCPGTRKRTQQAWGPAECDVIHMGGLAVEAPTAARLPGNLPCDQLDV